MLYQQKPYTDQSVGTIADLLLRSGQLQRERQTRLAQIQADLQMNQGNAAAGAALGRGQAMGNVFGNLAQIAGLVGRSSQPRTPAPSPDTLPPIEAPTARYAPTGLAPSRR